MEKRIANWFKTSKAGILYKQLTDKTKIIIYALKVMMGVFEYDYYTRNMHEPEHDGLDRINSYIDEIDIYKWNTTDEGLPELETPVFAYNEDTCEVDIAKIVLIPDVDTDDEYCKGWAKNYDGIYEEDGKIQADCEIDDDYNYTHYTYLPELPESIKESLK